MFRKYNTDLYGKLRTFNDLTCIRSSNVTLARRRSIARSSDLRAGESRGLQMFEKWAVLGRNTGLTVWLGNESCPKAILFEN